MKQFLSREYAELLRYGQVLMKRNGMDETKNNILFGEEKIFYLYQKFRLSEREIIWAFRRFLQSPDEI